MEINRLQRIEAVGYDYSAQDKVLKTKCDLCGETQLTVITHKDRYNYHARAMACNQCGLVFINPVMTGERYINFYDGIYRPLVSAYHGRLINANTIQDEQRSYAVERGELLAPYLEKFSGKTILDIGGSTGLVADYLVKQFSMKAVVLDPAPDELAEAEKLGLETVTGLVEDYDPGDRKFELVILCQTIDHLLEVNPTLGKIRSLLTDDGLFFVDIVDFRAAYLRNWSIEGAIKIDHPYYITEPVMEAYLKRNGFKILRKDFAADHLHISYICSKATSDKDYLPSTESVAELFREIRYVQNVAKE